MNLEIVAYEGYGSSDTDFKAQLTNIESTKPDVVFMPDYYNKVSLMAIQAVRWALRPPSWALTAGTAC